MNVACTLCNIITLIQTITFVNVLSKFHLSTTYKTNETIARGIYSHNSNKMKYQNKLLLVLIIPITTR